MEVTGEDLEDQVEDLEDQVEDLEVQVEEVSEGPDLAVQDLVVQELEDQVGVGVQVGVGDFGALQLPVLVQILV
jgi:archaellum component FlaC